MAPKRPDEYLIWVGIKKKERGKSEVLYRKARNMFELVHDVVKKKTIKLDQISLDDLEDEGYGSLMYIQMGVFTTLSMRSLERHISKTIESYTALLGIDSWAVEPLD